MIMRFSKRFGEAFLSLLIIIAIPLAAAAQDFTIENYQSDITINADSSVNVIETITVEFSRAKHGIYREIP